MASFNTITTVSRVGAPLPTSAGAAIMEDDLIKGMMQEWEFKVIVKDGEYAREIFRDAVSIGMASEMLKSFIKVEPADDGGMVIKVERSYKLTPVPRVEAQGQDEIAGNKEKGGPSNFKVKLD